MKEIVLTKGHVAIIDNDDYEIISSFSWYANDKKPGHVYAAKSGSQGHCLMEHIILGVSRGVDHINGDTLNNTRINLRCVTPSQNNMNSKKRKNTSSRFKGVFWNSGKSKWEASIKIDGRRIYLGRFTNEEEASYVYDKAAKHHFGEFARLNHGSGDLR